MTKDVQSDQYRKMTETPVPALIIRLGIPTTISRLVTNIYNMADTWFVGRIGTSASGAVGVVFGLMAIIQAFGFMFGHGAGSIISRRLGAKDVESAGRIASTGFFCAMAAGALIGYDDDAPLTRDTLVATVRAGDIDGTPRRGNGWQVEVRGARANVLGIACMDQLMIDVTDVPSVCDGDVVTFVGGALGVEEYARMGALNHNEAWARIGRRVPRIYFENGIPARVCAELESEKSI